MRCAGGYAPTRLQNGGVQPSRAIDGGACNVRQTGTHTGICIEHDAAPRVRDVVMVRSQKPGRLATPDEPKPDPGVIEEVHAGHGMTLLMELCCIVTLH